MELKILEELKKNLKKNLNNLSSFLNFLESKSLKNSEKSLRMW